MKLIDKAMATKEFIVATANYLLAEEAAREALKGQGIDPDQFKYVILADVEILDPIS